MSGIDYTTSGMVEAVKLGGLLPDTQNLYLPADIVDIMSREMHAIVVPLIMDAKQEYLVSSYDQDIDAGDTSFFIPFRAVGLKLRDCVLVDGAGQEIPIRRFEPEDLKDGFQLGNGVFGFYVDNDKINLLPTDGDFSQYTFRAKIFRRPNNLVQASEAGRITAINTSTKQVTLATMPTAFSTALTYDFIKGSPSFRAHAESQAVTTKLGFVLTFTAALPDDLAVGDWVAETGFSPIPQIPYDVFPLLQQRAIIKCLEGIKDVNGLKIATDAYDLMAARFKSLVSPRVDGSPQKIVSRRGIRTFSRLRGGMW